MTGLLGLSNRLTGAFDDLSDVRALYIAIGQSRQGSVQLRRDGIDVRRTRERLTCFFAGIGRG